MGEKKEKKSGLVVSCWILAFLIAIIIFFVKYDSILDTLEQTDFFPRVCGSTPEFIENRKDSDKKPETEPQKSEPKAEKKEPAAVIEIPLSTPKIEQPKPAVEPVPETKPQTPVEQPKAETKPAEHTKPVVTEKVEPKKEEPKPVKTETSVAKLYFVTISDNGKISRKYIERKIPKNDSPLTNNLNLLMAGPVGSEKSGCNSLIPSGTKLRSLRIKDGIAVINLSEEFEFNQYGTEGYQGSLMQIVYTATEFSTVNSVQILIEGQKKDYLGSEGYWIGSSLSRSSF